LDARAASCSFYRVDRGSRTGDDGRLFLRLIASKIPPIMFGVII
jgi:hypothetical protein